MSPELLALIVQLVELGIKEEPAIALELHNIFSTPNPSAADWQALREKVLGESFESLAPAAAANLPPETVTPPAGPVTVASQDIPAPAPEPPLANATPEATSEVASDDPGVTCPICKKPLVPNCPANCNC